MTGLRLSIGTIVSMPGLCGRCRGARISCGGGSLYRSVRGVSAVRGWGVMVVGLGKGVKNRVQEYGLVIICRKKRSTHSCITDPKV